MFAENFEKSETPHIMDPAVQDAWNWDKKKLMEKVFQKDEKYTHQDDVDELLNEAYALAASKAAKSHLNVTPSEDDVTKEYINLLKKYDPAYYRDLLEEAKAEAYGTDDEDDDDEVGYAPPLKHESLRSHSVKSSDRYDDPDDEEVHGEDAHNYRKKMSAAYDALADQLKETDSQPGASRDTTIQNILGVIRQKHGL